MTKAELDKILELHKKWLNDEEGGERANLSGADLSGANLSNADLYRANLLNADLSGAVLSNIRTNSYTSGFYPQCPEEGSFIGYKKARLEKIVVLKISEDAKRSSATTFKCRCDKAEVLRIENLDGSISDLKSINSLNDENFYYRVGETVFADSFDENRWNECSHGIHFFISRELARIYDG